MAGIVKGTILANRYEILARLGRGGMGTVYSAHDRELDDTVAVKVLRSDVGSSADFDARFRREIRLARRVRHPNVCAVHEYFQDGPHRFMVMEFISGTDFRAVLRQRGALDPGEAVEAMRQASAGLQAIHDAGIVHRDLKTANIMRAEGGQVRLMDFGIAKQFNATGTGVTETGHIVGTPEYMSPEQIRAEPLDARSDIYSLGIIFFELLTGSTPFRGDSSQLLAQHLHDAPDLEGRVPPVLLPVIAKALAKDRAARFDSASAFGEALRGVEVGGHSFGAGRASETRDPVSRTMIRPPVVLGATVPQLENPLQATPVLMQSPTAVPDSHATIPGAAAAGAGSPTLRLRRRNRGLAAALVASACAVLGYLNLRAPAPSGPPPASLPRGPTGTPVPPPPRTQPVTETSRPPSSQPSRPSAGATPLRGTVGGPLAGPRVRTIVDGSPAAVARPVAARTLPSTTPSAPSEPTAQNVLAPAVSAPVRDGRIVFVIRPWAEVTLDGKNVGTTPMAPLSVPPGDHALMLTHPRYPPAQRLVSVIAGETTTVEVDLRK